MKAMKQLFMIAVLCVTAMTAMAQKSTVNGKLENHTDRDTLMLYVSGSNKIDTLQVASDGKFTHTAEVNQMAEGLFMLVGRGGHGREHSCIILIEPEKTIDITLNLSKPDAEGKSQLKANINKADDVAKQQYAGMFYNVLTAGNVLAGEELLKTGSFAACQKKVDEVMKPILKTLEKVKDKSFAKQATQAVNAQKDNAYFAYATAAEQAGQKTEQDADFMKYVNSINPNDTANVNQILSYIQWYVQVHPEKYAPLTDNAAQLKCLGEFTKNADVRNKITSEFVRSLQLYEALGVNTAQPAFKELFEQMIALSTDAETLEYCNGKMEKMSNTMEGKPAINFSLQDIDGKPVEFKSLVGNGVVTYVDFWATWCGPCKREIPALAELTEQLKENKKIRIVSISIDEDHNAWKQMITQDKPTWEQYIIPDLSTSEAIKEYEINSIPRFMIFDGDGILNQNTAPRPSSAGTRALLESLVK